MESILWKESLYCCCKCAKFSSLCKIIFIYSCILSSVLWDTFMNDPTSEIVITIFVITCHYASLLQSHTCMCYCTQVSSIMHESHAMSSHLIASIGLVFIILSLHYNQYCFNLFYLSICSFAHLFVHKWMTG